MITFKDMIGNTLISDIPITEQHNIEDLLKRINVISELWNKPMKVTSGYRTIQDHLRIYRSKGIPENKIPMGSCHLKGKALDVYDPNGELKEWVLINIKKIEEVGLWLESFESTPNWVHFQSSPPKSGNRFFIP